MLTAHLDDSEADGASRILLLAGYIADTQRWLDFGNEWQPWLDKPPAIKALKMTAVYSPKASPWNAMTDPEKDARLEGFARIANKHALVGVQSIVDLVDYDEAKEMESAVPSEDPLYVAFSNTMRWISKQYTKAGRTDGLSIVFDMPSSPKAKKRMKTLFDGILDLGHMKGFEDVAKIDSVTFGDDEVLLPLQAADMMAWSFNRKYNEPNELERPLLSVIREKRIGGYAYAPSVKKLMGPEAFEQYQARMRKREWLGDSNATARR